MNNADLAIDRAEKSLEALAAGQITTAAAWSDRASEALTAAKLDSSCWDYEVDIAADKVRESRKAVTAWKARAKAERDQADDGRN